MCWYELYKFLSNWYIHVRVVLLCERQSPEWWRYCIEYVHRTDKLRDETSILQTEMKHSVKNHICYSKCHAQHSTKESLLRQHVHVSDWWHTHTSRKAIFLATFTKSIKTCNSGNNQNKDETVHWWLFLWTIDTIKRNLVVLSRCLLMALLGYCSIHFVSGKYNVTTFISKKKTEVAACCTFISLIGRDCERAYMIILIQFRLLFQIKATQWK